MASAVVMSACVVGATVIDVRVEVDIQPGLPYFSVIGLPDRRINEAKERVRSAIKNSGFSFPLGKITVNLSPSEVPKQGTGLDLAIALGILVASKRCRAVPLNYLVVGELALDGRILRSEGILPILITNLEGEARGVLLGRETTPDIKVVPECPVKQVSSLSEAVSEIGRGILFSNDKAPIQEHSTQNEYLIDGVQGQEEAKRALLIALAGKHHLMFTGPPGVGKTMLAKAAVQLLPRLSRIEALGVAKVHTSTDSLAILKSSEPPFRNLHHSSTKATLLGSTATALPGELSLAHKGILFLDEIAEMDRVVLESLRQPMQDKMIRLTRRGMQYEYPADCLVLAARNPCPCGLLGVQDQVCRCSTGDLERYERRLSEALLDRFDMFCNISVNGKGSEMKGKDMAENIRRVRDLQVRNRNVEIDKRSEEVLRIAAKKFYLSQRGKEKILAVARTIADLDESANIKTEHLAEAISYRCRGKNQP